MRKNGKFQIIIKAIMEILRRLKVNRVVKGFILSDLALFSGAGLISPIMSIFVIDHIEGADLMTIGIMTAIYWVVRSLLEIPIAAHIEKTADETDDMHALVLGMIIVSLASFALIFVKTVPQLYLYQVVTAIGFSFYGAAWAGIFSRHLDKGKESVSWSMDHTTVNIATAIFGFLGSVIAKNSGFTGVFVLTGVLTILAAVMISLVPEVIIPGGKKNPKPVIEEDHSAKEVEVM